MIQHLKPSWAPPETLLKLAWNFFWIRNLSSKTISLIQHIGSDTRFDSNLFNILVIYSLVNIIMRWIGLYNLAFTESCGIIYHLHSCCSIILVTVLVTSLWHNPWLIFLSFYHSSGYSLVDILVRLFMFVSKYCQLVA